MSTVVAEREGWIAERVVMVGDLARLNPQERVSYYRATCESLGLNPLTRPFEYINLSGKLTLYARKDCTDQLRTIHQISAVKVGSEFNKELGTYTMEVQVSTQDGRKDFAQGIVCVTDLKGDALANALMKAETKAKRRATLSIVGLGWLDESEISSIQDAHTVQVNDQGEIVHGTSEPSVDERKVTEKQIDRLYAIAESKHGGRANAAVGKLLERMGVVNPEDLNRTQYDQVCRTLETGEITEADEQPPATAGPKINHADKVTQFWSLVKAAHGDGYQAEGGKLLEQYGAGAKTIKDLSDEQYQAAVAELEKRLPPF